MTTLWLGDFRLKQLQQYYDKALAEEKKRAKAMEKISDKKDSDSTTKPSEEESTEKPASKPSESKEFKYFIDDCAEYSWLSTNATAQLPLMYVSGANLVIMLGFNDCVYSCVWDTFNISDIVAKYTKTIDELMELYQDLKFYVCSVNPIDSDYPFAAAKNGIISKKDLTNKIEQFNKELKKSCNATFIDSYYYLANTSYDTRDGIHYTQSTCKNILAYILGHFNQVGGISFVPRLTAPDTAAMDVTEPYWLSSVTNSEGLNPFPNTYNKGLSGAKHAHDTLPNCTAYAWGRFYELLGSRPNLSTGNAEQWYGNTADGYDRGKTPRLGAVLCWQAGATLSGGDGAGHVAIVEQINDDGSILTSESGWDDSRYWWTKIRKDDGNWGASSSYKFQGFIYLPNVTSGKVGDYVTKSQTVSIANRYFGNYDGTVDDKQKINARYIWQYLGSKGWSLNAVAGILGNMQSESSLNPALLEAIKGVSWPSADATDKEIEDYAYRYKAAHKNNRFPGYGLVQWTGKYAAGVEDTWKNQKYIHWCSERNLSPSDIDSQIERIIWECDNEEQFSRYYTKYESTGITFKEFSTSEKSAYDLAGIFLACYERPGYIKNDNRPDERGKQAEAWYEYLLPYAPGWGPVFMVDNYKADHIAPDKATMSFIATNLKSGMYALLNEDGNYKYSPNDIVLSKSKTRSEETEDEEVTSEESEDKKDKNQSPVDIVTFDLLHLEPNTKYQALLTAKGKNDGDVVEEAVEFTTPQSYPEEVKEASLTIIDSNGAPNSSIFKLHIKPVDNWGYWAKRTDSYGYEVKLLINGECVSIYDLKNKNELKFTLDKNSCFKGKYTIKLADTIQLGVCSWILDNNKNKVYSSEFSYTTTKTTTPICFLAHPIRTYLKTEIS